MYDATGTVIYVGKAKDLKKRLASYFRQQIASRKTETLVKNIAQIDITVTHTETEALLLEHNYIKQYQPRYNVLLRDDKSYPLIFLSADSHPRLAIHRGAKHAKGNISARFPIPTLYVKRWCCCKSCSRSANVKTVYTAIDHVLAYSIRLAVAWGLVSLGW